VSADLTQVGCFTCGRIICRHIGTVGYCGPEPVQPFEEWLAGIRKLAES
jgi:hypothetical protein